MAIKVGIQLYSIKGEMKKDPYAALGRLATSGYKFIEAANHSAATDDGIGFGVPAHEMRKILDGSGIDIVGCHINPLNLDRLPAVLDYHAELGNPQIGCDTEFFPYSDYDYLKRRCEFFNEVGRMCRERGMRYYCHNHYMEFQTFDNGEVVFDMMMKYTDPELVFAELDTYWVMRGGQDPVKYIDRYKDRLILLHQKDFPKEAPQPVSMFDGVINPDANVSRDVFGATKNTACFTEIGTGIMDIQAIVDAANACPHLGYVLLEQDATTLDEFESIGVSMREFKKLSGLAWA